MNNRRNQLMLASAREYCKCVVEGKTIKYNQLSSLYSGVNETWLGMTVTTSGNYISVVGTSTYSGQEDINNYSCVRQINVKANHKYVIYCSSNIFCLFLYGLTPSSEIAKCSLLVAQSTGTYDTTFRPIDSYSVRNGISINEQFFVLCIDLTALGLDSISSPSEFLETDLGKYVAKGNYLETSEGAFIQAKTPINFKGANLLNLSRTKGTLSGFDNTNTRNFDTTKYYVGLSDNNYYAESNITSYSVNAEKVTVTPRSSGYGIVFPFLVKPNKRYLVHYVATPQDNSYFVSWFDKNGTYISVQSNNEGTFKAPNNAYFGVLCLRPNVNIETTYTNIFISENIWDENWEIGAINTGTGNNNNATDDNIRSAGYVKIEPSQTYYFISLSHHCSAFFYDKNKQYLGDDYIIGDIYSNFVTPRNAYYMRFYTWEGNTYNNDIAIFYYGYQRYCGTNVLMEGFVFQKGDTYKSWGLDDIEYNQSIPNDKQDFTNTTTDTRQSLIISIYDYSVNKFVWGVEGVNTTGKHSWIFTSNESCTQARLMDSGSSDNIYFVYDLTFVATHKYFISMNIEQINPTVVGGLVIKNIILIDLTLLGLDNISSVADFNKTPLGRLIAKGYYLPYTTTNKTTKEQLVRTMKEIDLSSLTWTYISAMTSHSAVLPSDIKNDTQNALTEKYKQFVGTGYPQRNCFKITSGTIVVNTGSSTQPSGKILIELEQPTLIMWQTLDIGDYHEFVATDTPNIFKLNRDLSEYGVIDITTDYGTKMSNLTQLNIFGGDGDYCYQDGFIYQKSSDIENAWIYQIQISNAPSRMVSRRTINVESDNGVDLDFTKE